MLRTILLVLRNEFRLLLKDQAALFMLFLAPIVIIAVAGFSLGNMFGVQPSGNKYLIPIVNNDHGLIAKAIIQGLSHEPALQIDTVAGDSAARSIVARNDDSPLAIVIPAGTTRAFESGRTARVRLYVDPVKRVEASALELRLNELTNDIAAKARGQAQIQLSEASANATASVKSLEEQVSVLREEAEEYQQQIQRARSAFRAALEARIREKVRQISTETREELDQLATAQKAALQAELSRKQAALIAVSDYMHKLQSSRRAFEQWLARLKAAAGSYATEIPPPPQWPTPPSREQLAILATQVNLPTEKLSFANRSATADPSIKIPPIRIPPMPRISLDVRELLPGHSTVLPGNIDWQNRPLTPGYAHVNSFDQYVPGFGITFLLIDVLWGVSVGLIDERDWGTLQRLRVSGAPISGLMIGKLASRFLTGFVQMVVLLSVGWVLFGIELGRSPLMLLLPTAAIAFAAAAFGLIIAGIARTRDAVLPIGSVAAMTMSAIGGCWWPINFEPAWMRSVAAWMPTTWTMRAYNDLMIRGLDPSHAILPSLITIALGIAFLGIGVIAAARVYE